MRLMQDLVGDTLSNRYRLIARVAGGGMGEVYRGHDLLLDRTVAVKVLQPSLASDPVLVDRFRAEARAAARLSHPNVVAVHDWGSEDEYTYYMVMEYVAGTDLRNVLVGRGLLEPAQAVQIMASVCDALAASHAQGLIHRDVKPENVLIARDGTVKVADFGIAVVADADRTAPGGGIPGTLRYLAPEQAAGREATKASDLWAAGAVLAELLTGRPPMQGTGADLLRRRAEEEPDLPSKRNPAVPRELDEIVIKACALSPAQRFLDASSMADALRRAGARSMPDAAPLDSLLEDVTGEIRLPDLSPTSFTRSRRPRRRPRTVMRQLAAVLLLLVVAAGGVKAATVLMSPDQVEVPKLEGMMIDEAEAVARAAGLEVEVTGRVKDAKAPRKQVVSQSPTSGRLEEGTTVELILSSGPPMYPVPLVTGFDVSRAGVFLRGRGMRVGDISEQHSDRPVGTVVGQRPGDGRVRLGATIRLVVSKGPRPVSVPNVAGSQLNQGIKSLKAAGFKFEIVKEFSSDVAEGIIISTTPGGGTDAEQGSEVQVTVSKGVEFEKLKLPDVRGQSSSQARATLEGLGLKVKILHPCGSGDTVNDTQPLAGSTVREGQQISVFVY